MKNENETSNKETVSPYPGDFVSSKIDSLGKYSIDTSDEFAESMVNIEPRVVNSMERLDRLVALEAPDVIIEDSKKIIERRKLEAREMIDEYNNPEKYRNNLDRFINKKKSFDQFYITNRLNKIFNYWEQSPYIEHILGLNEEEKDKKQYISAILAKDDNGEYKVSTEQFRNFLQWHNYEHRKAEKKLSESVPEYKKNFISMLNEGVTSGALPKNAMDNINAIEEIQDIRLDDGLDSAIKHRMGNYRESGIVTFSPDYLYQDGELINVNHEFLHVIGGKCRPKDELYGYSSNTENDTYFYWAENEARSTGTVFERLSPAKQEKLKCYFRAVKVLRESACENILTKLLNNPNVDHAYEPERNFISELIMNSNGALSENDFESAFFENDFNKFSDFMDKIRSSFPAVEDIFLEIGKIKNWDNDPKAERLLNAIFGKDFTGTVYDKKKNLGF